MSGDDQGHFFLKVEQSPLKITLLHLLLKNIQCLEYF